MRNEIKQYLKDHIYLVPMQIGSETVGREKAWVKARVCGNVAVTFIRNRNIFDIICYCGTNAGNYYYISNKGNFHKSFGKLMKRTLKKHKLKINDKQKKLKTSTIDRIIDFAGLLSNELDAIYKKHIVAEKIKTIEKEFENGLEVERLSECL
jgi:hypothetical protein